MALLNLLRLAELTQRESWRKRAESMLRAFGDAVEDQPYAFSEMLLGVDFHTGPAKQIAIVVPADRRRSRQLAPAKPFLDVLRRP